MLEMAEHNQLALFEREDWHEMLHAIPGADEELEEIRHGLSQSETVKETKHYTERLMNLVVTAFKTDNLRADSTSTKLQGKAGDDNFSNLQAQP